MTTALFLIAHKVRGEPAFDIAQHMTCPKCEGTNEHCPSCDGAGHWWIIPTSGHRAFPYFWLEMADLEGDVGQGYWDGIRHDMPLDLRDHYTTTREAAVNLASALGLDKPKPSAPIIRRF